MKKGDLAFFYQSNCKEPGIVGTMEIVQEHSPDRELLIRLLFRPFFGEPRYADIVSSIGA